MSDQDQGAALPNRIYHVTFSRDWVEAERLGEYRLSTRGARLEDVGYIHASHAHQVRQIGRSHYLDAAEPVVVLVIDPTRVQSAIKVERVGDGTEQYPHIYGPLDISAVVDVLPATVERGEFLVERLPVVNFDQGLPDPAHFPVALLQQCIAETFEYDGAAALTYYGRGGPAEMQYGYLGLREQLAEWMSRRDGRAVDPQGVVLANGSTDGLALAINAHLGPGDGAIVEAATYPYTRRFTVETGASVRTVPLDEQGMVVDALPDVLAALRDDGTPPKLIATIPSFHSPTGTLLPRARRERLLELAHEWDLLVLEDNCYHAFFYDAPPPPTLLALDGEGRVLHSDTFSKSIAPGLRMAWVAGAPHAIEPLTQVRQDFAVSQLLARALERYLAAGHLDTHLAELREVYRRKRDITAAPCKRTARTGCDSQCPAAASTSGSSSPTPSTGSSPARSQPNAASRAAPATRSSATTAGAGSSASHPSRCPTPTSSPASSPSRGRCETRRGRKAFIPVLRDPMWCR